MKQKKVKKLILKSWVKIFIVLVLIILAAFSVYLIINGLKPVDESVSVYDYFVKKNIDYKVYLKDNDFYEEEYLDASKEQYPSELADYIDIDFNYMINGSKTVKFDYSYELIGTVIGEYETKDGKSELWTKKYNYIPTQNRINEGTELNISEKIKIDYTEYNDVVSNFRENFKLAIDSYLRIILNVKYKITLEDYDEVKEDQEQILIDIPLTKTTFNPVRKNLTAENKKIKNERVLYNYNQASVGIVLLVTVIVIAYFLETKMNFKTESNYEKQMKKIIKTYGDIIVESATPINYTELEIIEVKKFGDIVDAEEELRTPIVLFEAIKDEETHFVLVNGTYAYRFILDKDTIL